jgi:vacuolar-type H+-ATPase subunit E/Vma4
VGYPELLGALEEEVVRQIRQLDEDTADECRRLVASARERVAAERRDALARERRRLDDEERRAVGSARLEQARSVLADERRLLADLRREAEGRLPALDDLVLIARLLDELAPELSGGPVELRVRRDREAAVRELVNCNRRLGDRVTVRGIDTAGGVLASLEGGRVLLDNSLESRLDRAWAQMEPIVAADLFGETDVGRM